MNNCERKGIIVAVRSFHGIVRVERKGEVRGKVLVTTCANFDFYKLAALSNSVRCPVRVLDIIIFGPQN